MVFESPRAFPVSTGSGEKKLSDCSEILFSDSLTQIMMKSPLKVFCQASSFLVRVRQIFDTNFTNVLFPRARIFFALRRFQK